MPLHPQMQWALDTFFTSGPRAATDGVEVARAHLEDMAAKGAPYMDAIHEVYDVEIPGSDGVIVARVLRPSDDRDLPVLVWFHGGGFVTGSHRTHDGVMRPIANQIGGVVVIPHYRLAPEHPFPAAFDDCRASLDWVIEHCEELGGDPGRIAIGGDSAGGNLAAAVALDARNRGHALSAQVLVYPSVDDDFARPSMVDNAAGYGLETSQMEWFLDAYAPDTETRGDWRLFPMKADSLAGAAPALVLTAEYDPLRDEGEAYAARLAADGVDTTAIRYDGLIHGFFGMWVVVEPARQALLDTVGFLRRKFGEEQ